MDYSNVRLLDAAKRFDLLEEREIRKLVLAAGMSNSNHLQRSVSKAVLSESIQHWRYPFDTGSVFGSLEIGESFDGQSFKISQNDLSRHLLAVGQSGSGKTTLFYNLMDQLGKPFWSFDLKQDYRHLIHEEDDLLVLPWQELKLNPLVPPKGVFPRRWIQVFSEIFGHATSLLSGSKNHLMRKLVELYQVYGLFEEVSPPFPSLHELEQLVKREGINYVRKQSDYRDTLLNRLEAMNLIAGTIFDCSQGYPIEELLQRDVVFEFDGLSRDVQNFLMEILFAYIFEYRLAQNHRDTGLNHVFFLDEGKRVFSVYKERREASGIPEIDELTAKMREFGEGLVAADQEASKLTESIKANTYTKLLLSTGSRKQFDAVAGSMNLSERQREFAQDLGIGEAVVQVGNRPPIPVKLQNYEVEKEVTDEELEKKQREKWSKLEYTERERTQRFRERIASGRSDEVPEPVVPDDPQEVDLSNEADRLLKGVVENPFKGLTERYERFTSWHKGNEAKDELVNQGVVIEREVRTRERRRKLLQLTEKGRDYVENDLEVELEREGRGGIIHQYWQHRIRKTFEEAGWHAFVEKFDADVYVNMNTSELVVEVAMGNNERELRHVKQHLETGFSNIWIVCRNQEVRDGLEQRLEENDLLTDPVAFRLFREFNNEEIPDR